jgi:hypothetical protein
MKNNIRILIIVCLLACSGMAKAQMNPRILLLDSVYTSNWVSNSWSLNLKDYLLLDNTGRTTKSLYEKFNTASSDFLNYAQILYDYAGTSSVPVRLTDQLWASNLWNTYQYYHYKSGNKADTAWSKVWSNLKQKFVSGTLNTYQYNDSLLPLANLTSLWDTTSLTWVNSEKSTYTYTPLMQPSKQIDEVWEKTTSSWKNILKDSNTYDANNLLITHLEYEWNDTAFTWNNTLRISYTNNGVALPTQILKENWNTSLAKWDTFELITNIYNPSTYWLMTINTQTFNQISKTFVNSYITYNTYFPTGIIASSTGGIWDTVHSVYITNFYQKTDSLSYKIGEQYTYSVSQGTFNITGGTRNLYTYTQPGDTLTSVTQQWNVLGSLWDNKSQELYTYDNHKLLTNQLYQDWTDSTSIWVNNKKVDYFYNDFIGIAEHSAKNKPCFYSNPVVAGTTIYCPDFTAGNEYTLKISSLTGAEVFRTDFRGGESVKFSGSLVPGLYLMIIEAGNKIVYKDKIIVMN